MLMKPAGSITQEQLETLKKVYTFYLGTAHGMFVVAKEDGTTIEVCRVYYDYNVRTVDGLLPVEIREIEK